ncbi:NPC intracellular cholesterol transporter 2 homolog a-like [Dysidea avara]|uniref:NPC intracellular cholesterol transporter 2 homolog a-like n=1 Tax=Dysidea avara TaxID=196820 RepID=UPI00332D23BD
MKVFCAVLFFSVVVVTHAVMYKDCGSKSCKINAVDVDGCAATAESCDFHRGTTVNMTLKFTAIEKVDKLKNSLQGNVGGTWIPFSSSDACSSITPSCPVAANAEASFQISVAISKLYPQISVPVRDELKDESGAECACFLVQGKIV